MPTGLGGSRPMPYQYKASPPRGGQPLPPPDHCWDRAGAAWPAAGGRSPGRLEEAEGALRRGRRRRGGGWWLLQHTD